MLVVFWLGFKTLFNILGHQRRFQHRAWKVLQILLRGSNFDLRFFYCLKSTTRDPRFYFPSDVILRIFTLWKNPSTPAGIEPANLGSRGGGRHICCVEIVIGINCYIERVGFLYLWSGQKPWWNWNLTPMVNFGEVRRAQLAKFILLISTSGPLGSFQIFEGLLRC